MRFCTSKTIPRRGNNEIEKPYREIRSIFFLIRREMFSDIDITI